MTQYFAIAAVVASRPLLHHLLDAAVDEDPADLDLGFNSASLCFVVWKSSTAWPTLRWRRIDHRLIRLAEAILR